MAGTPSPAEARTSSPAVREDCWSAEATETLIEAWGERYVDLNRGNLRQKHWREVADAVNHRHGHVAAHHRTDIQCKNRIDTLKKKYKIERARVSDSDPHAASPWPFFARLHRLIGQSFSAKKPSPSQSQSPPPRRMVPLAWSVPVGRRSKRPAAAVSPADDSSYFLRDHEDHAAAEEEEDSEGSRSSTASRRRERGGGKKRKAVSFGELAQAIEKFGEIYERVEGTKQRQMIELEKQRMQFAMDLEYQRMQLFKDTQVELQKIKRARRSSGADGYS